MYVCTHILRTEQSKGIRVLVRMTPNALILVDNGKPTHTDTGWCDSHQAYTVRIGRRLAANQH